MGSILWLQTKVPVLWSTLEKYRCAGIFHHMSKGCKVRVTLH
jgi:hypothetical protein